MKKNIVPITLVWFLLAVSGGVIIAGEVYAGISVIERAALIDLYKSTNGDYWGNNTGWKEPPLHSDGFAMPGTECQWYGIWCDAENKHVEELYLRNNELSGSIPASIRNFSFLRILYLDDNDLTDIPDELGELLNLEYLYLSSSHLSGAVPATLIDLNKLVDDESDFSNNSLCTSDPKLLAFLNRKQSGGDWESTQNLTIRSVIIILQVIAGFQTEGSPGCDINADNRIGLEEIVHILQKISKLK